MPQILIDFLRDHRGMPVRAMTIFNYLLEAAVAGGILILLMLLVRRVLRKQLGSRMIYAAWLLVAVRLLVPIALPNPLMNELRPTLSTDQAARPVANQINVRLQDGLSSMGWTLREMAVQQTGNDLSELASGTDNAAYRAGEFLGDVAAYSSYGWMGKWVLIAYLAVTGGVAIGMMARNAAFRRRLRRGRIGGLPREVQARYEQLCRERRVRMLPVYLVDPLPSACLVGVVRPYIALPVTMQAEDMPLALTHELCHHKAGDGWWTLLRNVCCAEQWFNPLVWIGARVCRSDCELACDDRVTEGMDGEQRRAYATLLLSTASRKRMPGLTVVATGMTMTGKRLRQRIERIVHSHRVRRAATAVFSVFACVVTLFAFAMAEDRGDGVSLELNAAFHAMSLDDPYPLAENCWTDFSAMTRGALTDADSAISQAKALAQSDPLSLWNAAAYDWSARQVGNDWYVMGIPTDVAYGVSFVFSRDGQLMDYDARALSREEVLERQGRLPSNMDEAMGSFIDVFARKALHLAGATNYAMTADQYTTSERYISGTASLHTEAGEVPCGFTLLTSYPTIVAFHRMDRQTPGVVVQANAMEGAQRYLRDTVKLDDAAVMAAVYTVNWYSRPEKWLVTAVVSAEMLTGDSQVILTDSYGTAARYRLTMTFDGATGTFEGVIGAGEGTIQPTVDPYADYREVVVPLTVKLPEGGSVVYNAVSRAGENASFSEPPAEAMTMEQALNTALSALWKRYGVLPSDFEGWRMLYGYCAEDGYFTAPYWQFDFSRDADSYEIIVHSPDGEILYSAGPGEGNG